MDDLGNKHEVDQALAEALNTGNVRAVGENQYELTAKGVTRVAIMVLSNLIVSADKEGRDFTEKEKTEVLKYVKDIEGKIEHN